MDTSLLKRRGRLMGLAVMLALTACFNGCARKQTVLDDRPLERKPHVETEEKLDKADPFRP